LRPASIGTSEIIDLHRLRPDAKQMTPEEIAKSVGLSARYASAIKCAEVSATVTVLGRIADMLNIAVTDLFRNAMPKDGDTVTAVGHEP
jgi:transcriptional regulator with XRE-family HTH domain